MEFKKETKGGGSTLEQARLARETREKQRVVKESSIAIQRIWRGYRARKATWSGVIEGFEHQLRDLMKLQALLSQKGISIFRSKPDALFSILQKALLAARFYSHALSIDLISLTTNLLQEGPLDTLFRTTVETAQPLHPLRQIPFYILTRLKRQCSEDESNRLSRLLLELLGNPKSPHHANYQAAIFAENFVLKALEYLTSIFETPLPERETAIGTGKATAASAIVEALWTVSSQDTKSAWFTYLAESLFLIPLLCRFLNRRCLALLSAPQHWQAILEYWSPKAGAAAKASRRQGIDVLQQPLHHWPRSVWLLGNLACTVELQQLPRQLVVGTLELFHALAKDLPADICLVERPIFWVMEGVSRKPIVSVQPQR